MSFESRLSPQSNADVLSCLVYYRMTENVAFIEDRHVDQMKKLMMLKNHKIEIYLMSALGYKINEFVHSYIKRAWHVLIHNCLSLSEEIAYLSSEPARKNLVCILDHIMRNSLLRTNDWQALFIALEVTVMLVIRAVELGKVDRAQQIIEWFSTTQQMMIDKKGGWENIMELLKVDYEENVFNHFNTR